MGSDTYDVDKTLREGLASIKSAENSTLAKTPAPAEPDGASAASFHSYNRTDAASYAVKYALTYNSGQFMSWAPYGGDCVDFASQCIWYGLGGREVSAFGYAPPMNALWNMASDGNPKTSSFVSMSAFYAMINTGYPETTPHLSGDCYAQGGVANASPGDIIQIFNGSKWFHTYVVCSVTGSPGERTPLDIQVCAHNSDIQNVNFYTQWAQGHPNAYRLIKINGAYC